MLVVLPLGFIVLGLAIGFIAAAIIMIYPFYAAIM